MLVEFAIVGVCIISLFALLGLVLIMMERKVSAWMQLRLGPNRVGPGGMFQTAADTLKLMVKEGLTPDGADKFLFNLAPFIVMIIAMVIMAPLMFAKGLQIWDVNIGILFVAAVSSVSVIGILMAGWASNNKYSLLGAMRSGAQIVSYELSVPVLPSLLSLFLPVILRFLPSSMDRQMDGGYSKAIFLSGSHLSFL